MWSGEVNDLAGKIRVDFRSDEPIYLQIARQIETLMTHGGLNPGDQLPTVRQLATELRINFNTVSRAYRTLDESGLISTQRGRGTFVWEQPSEETERSLRQQELEELTRRYLNETRRLGFSQEETIQILEAMGRAWKENEVTSQ
jgi:GntR family transcriptional regulator